MLGQLERPGTHTYQCLNMYSLCSIYYFINALAHLALYICRGMSTGNNEVWREGLWGLAVMFNDVTDFCIIYHSSEFIMVDALSTKTSPDNVLSICSFIHGCRSYS